MKKKTNWKHVAITTLSITNLLLIGTLGNGNGTHELAYEVRELENELYMLQVETGLYNESSTDTIRNPMTGKIETMLINNHKNGRY